MVEGDKLEFLNVKFLSKTFVLELIESVLVNDDGVFTRHPEQSQILRERLMPLIVRLLSERHNFTLTVRVARVLLLLLKNYMSILTAECEVVLGLLIHLLDTEVSVPWKRVLCMEIFRALYNEPNIVRLIYTLFDKQEGRKNILRDHMACLVRLASEKPSLLGVGNQSTLPIGPNNSKDTLDEQVALEAAGVAGVIGTPQSNAGACGISSHWSLVRVQYIDILDKVDAPSPPDTYIYTLVLSCIGAFSESIARFVLPLTVAESKNRKRQRASLSSIKESDHLDQGGLQRKDSTKSSKKSSTPLNPLNFESHPQIDEIRACAGIIETCWPAILATCSTYLYAALDNEFYHNLVRSFQKLTHVAGLLRLSTPRDAFLTTIGKAAVPTESVSLNSPGASASQELETWSSLNPDSSVPKASGVSDLPSPSADGTTISTRNLLCLRALLNLGIALGPTLDQPSWSIIIETLQHADLVISVSTVTTPKSTSVSQNKSGSQTAGVEIAKANLGSEVIAVDSAASKMFESTSDYPSAQFKSILTALLGLYGHIEEAASPSQGRRPKSPRSPQASRSLGRLHQNKSSISLVLGRSRVQEDELKFVLDKVNELARANTERFASPQDEAGIWHILVENLVSVTRNSNISQNLRLKAGESLDSVVLQSIKLSMNAPIAARNEVQSRGLSALKLQISTLYDSERLSTASSRATDIEVHELALEALKSILEGCGESLIAGWDSVFTLISSVFDESVPTEYAEKETVTPNQPASRNPNTVVVKSPKLVRTAHNSLQFVVSDFLGLLPSTCLLELVETFSKFASQKEDFNISLTSATSFWNLSDFLRSQIDHFSFEGHVDDTTEEHTIVSQAKDPDPLRSRNSLWLLLLLRVVDLSTDSRSEIRNSAIHTALRIIDAYGQQMPPNAWHLCLNRVLFVMAELVQFKLLSVLRSTRLTDADESKLWIETLMVMTKGLSNLIANYFDSIIEYTNFEVSWKRLLEFYNVTIRVRSLELSESTFASFSEILTRIQDSGTLDQKYFWLAWGLWEDGHPLVAGDMHDKDISNQGALLAYIRTFEEIYRLHKSEMTEDHIVKILDNMRIAVWESVPSPYSPDVDRQSELQRLVIECLKTLCIDRDSSQPAILSCLSEFSDSALTKQTPAHNKGPTFVAFSKAAMQLSSWYISSRGIRSDILSDNTLNVFLEHIGNPLTQKYSWRGKDRDPVLWQVATTASLDVLGIAIPHVETQYSHADTNALYRFWKSVVIISRGIISASGYKGLNLNEATIYSDETFDITAFNRLKSLVIPSFGSPHVPEKARRDFACALFNSSLMYSAQRLDFSHDTIEDEPLRNLYKIRLGRTYDPPPTPRSKIAYVLLDTLFDLASSRVQSSSEHLPPSSTDPYVLLAKSISPYLILRCAIPLKSYIADQPLRGLMPQPKPARGELLYILRRLDDLRSEPAAIPSAGPTVSLSPGEKSQDNDNENDSGTTYMYNKHLGWMYPFVVKAIKVAGKETEDNRVLEALGKILQSISRAEPGEE